MTNRNRPNVFGFGRLHEAKNIDHKQPQCFGHEYRTLDPVNELEWQNQYPSLNSKIYI